MPTYSAPRRGVTLSEALQEAATIAPIERVVFSTFELWHPLGTPDGPIYVVNNFEDLSATKEADADRDAGLTVTFMASSVELDRPDEDDNAPSPEIALRVGNVQGIMSDAIRRARGSLEPWQIVERLYASDETDGPAATPLRLIVTGVDITAEVVTLTCGYGDPANVAMPRTTFKRSEYPSLVR